MKRRIILAALLATGMVVSGVMPGTTSCEEPKKEIPAGRPEKKKEPLAPDKALGIAVKALSDAKHKLWDDYEIRMSLNKEKAEWIVDFDRLPASPGFTLTVFVEPKGATRILLGK